MMNNEKKAAQFIKAINAEADAKCEALKKETDTFVNRELKKAREIAKENAKTIAKKEINRLDEQTNTDSYKSRVEQTKHIVSKRDEITNRVFELASEKIKEFTKSDAYEDFLKESVQKITAAIGEQAIIFISPEDEKFIPALSKLCAGVEIDKTIILGGCKGSCPDASMKADDTLDSRLDLQRKEFYQTSGLSIIG